MNQTRRKHLRNILLIAVNAVLIVGLVLVFFAYDADYKKKLFSQNVEDITNINQAAANISSAFFTSQEVKLRDVASFVTENGYSLQQTLDYIHSTNTDDSRNFEILAVDGKGYRIETASSLPIAVQYSSNYQNITQLIQKNAEYGNAMTVGFAPEFTDDCTARKSFALHCTVHLPDGDGERIPYTLMLVADSASFADLIHLDSGYDELATVLVNGKGEYIIGSSSFKSDNFFQYLYVFNDLTLDQQKAIRSQFLTQGKGSLQYRDSMDRDCVFVYARVPDRDWYCITAVPTAYFHNRSFDLSFTIVVIIVLLTLLATDFLYLAGLNRQLRSSVENERVASAAKTDFLSRMSHDIRTPLNVIIGMSLLAQQEENPPATRNYIGNIVESGKFLLGLVNDILDLNKVESGKMELHPEPYCYSEFRRHISAVIEPLCREKDIQFIISEDIPDRYVLLDRLRFNQIFFNLLSNAVKFTPEGGCIHLLTKARLLPENRVSFDVEVRDNGIGMSREFQAHMFEAFSQETRRETAAIHGTGLGLAIVENLVHLMGGQLRVESEPGKGTSFFLHIETQLASAPEKAEAPVLSDDLLAGKHILLCEDHPLNAQIAMRILENKQMRVDHAENGSIGVEKFSASPIGSYDLILMDIRMPVMDGLAATRTIRALPRPDAAAVPIIAMTANAYDTDKQNCYAAGMNAHVAKPIDPQVLFKTMEKALLKP